MIRAPNYDISPAISRKSPDVNSADEYDVSSARNSSAILYTLLISARNHGIDPQAYLKDVIERLPSMRPADLDALLPSAWAAAHRAKHPLAKPDRTATAA